MPAVGLVSYKIKAAPATQGVTTFHVASAHCSVNQIALETDGLIQVFDVWESQESEGFGQTLLPILADNKSLWRV
jgi:hypothetical protein